MSLNQGASVTVMPTLQTPAGQVDAAAAPIPATWDNQAGLPMIIQTGVPSTSLPSDIQSLLNATYDNTNTLITGITATLTGAGGAVAQTLGQIFSGKTLDVLTEGDLGSKCHPEVLTATVPIGGSAYGLLTEALSWPDWYAFTGPAGDYAQQVLYTLRLARGGNVVLWQGVHTTTHLVYPLPGIPNIGIGLVNLPVDPGEYTITITPNTGVCVGAQLLGFP
jgi:hypothetical protein